MPLVEEKQGWQPYAGKKTIQRDPPKWSSYPFHINSHRNHTTPQVRKSFAAPFIVSQLFHKNINNWDEQIYVLHCFKADEPWSWDRRYTKKDAYGQTWPRHVHLHVDQDGWSNWNLEQSWKFSSVVVILQQRFRRGFKFILLPFHCKYSCRY